ncbi:hypothetical protein ILYODFUR_013299 [Ilyodon furcidens]|uniref:Uncharacterized protein n=1 Tax=Ilyodon furcidens TaxID=33524 RepID=A0ABV0TYD2_9TELE
MILTNVRGPVSVRVHLTPRLVATGSHEGLKRSHRHGRESPVCALQRPCFTCTRTMMFPPFNVAFSVYTDNFSTNYGSSRCWSRICVVIVSPTNQTLPYICRKRHHDVIAVFTLCSNGHFVPPSKPDLKDQLKETFLNVHICSRFD